MDMIYDIFIGNPLFWIGAIAGGFMAYYTAAAIVFSVVIKSNDWGYQDEGNRTIAGCKIEDEEDEVDDDFPLYPENEPEKKKSFFPFFRN